MHVSVQNRMQSPKQGPLPLYLPLLHLCSGAAMLTWSIVLLLAERRQIAEVESVKVYKASKNSVVGLTQCRKDTVYFKNNWKEETVSITRNSRDTTIPMVDNTNQFDFYSRLSYDLRNPLWNLDSLVIGYDKLSGKQYSATFSRLDGKDNVLEHTSDSARHSFLPISFQTPLGYIEGHILQTYLVFPWTGFLVTHLPGFAMASLYLLFMGWSGFLLSGYEQQQRAFRRFRYRKNQEFIIELQELISQIHRNEIETDTIVRNNAWETDTIQLERNIRHYEHVLQKINLLLDRTIALQRL